MKNPAQALYITSTCIIRADRVICNGQTVLTNTADLALSGWLKQAYQHLGMEYPKFHKMDVLSKAVLLAAEWISHTIPLSDTNPPLVFSNYSSSIVSDTKHATGIFHPENPIASPATFVYTLPNIAMGEVSIRHQLHNEHIFFIFERFMPEFLAPYVMGMFGRDEVRHILAGWVEVGLDDTCDVFLYSVSQTGELPHTIENLNAIYNEDYE